MSRMSGLSTMFPRRMVGVWRRRRLTGTGLLFGPPLRQEFLEISGMVPHTRQFSLRVLMGPILTFVKGSEILVLIGAANHCAR